MPYTSDSHEFDKLIEANPDARKILAEGDSWFAYPRRFLIFGPASNIVEHLGKRRNYIIYSTASNGDEAVSMLSGEHKHAMMKRIKAHDYDFILFSGGGNDIVGRFDFDLFVDKKETGMTASDCINTRRLNRKLDQIASIYEELIERVAKYSPNTKIVTHTYDFAIPTGKGYELFDIFPIGESWMHPILKEQGITDKEEQKLIIRTILIAFKEKLAAVQAQYSSQFYVVNTQGLLTENQWRNELHPTPAGFKLVSQKIADVLESLS